MTYRDTLEARHTLHAVAVTQGGFFTAKQACDAGYQYSHLAYHVQSGNFERVDRGLYRLKDIPPAEHEDLVRLALWSRDRDDAPQAVVSHDTALALQGLSDVVPPRVHLTVPPTFRKSAPRGVVLHKARLDTADLEDREGFRITTPLRTLIDAATTKSVSDEQFNKAVADALDKGLIRKSQIASAIRTVPAAAERLTDAIHASA
jgi:predicted transcriptional regulator of viral defense system